MKRLTALIILLANFTGINAQDVYHDYRSAWLNKCQQLMPELHSIEKRPMRVVSMFPDAKAYQKVKAVQSDAIDAFYRTPLKRNEQKSVIDFGEHITGSLHFRIESNIAAHAPVRLKIKFAEMPAEMYASFDAYEGTLSQAWLQEEVITVHTLPADIALPGRYSFRYLKFEILASAGDMEFYIRDVYCTATSSAGADLLATSAQWDEAFQAVSDVSIRTLRECMQTVFEDGPKRDRRIWIGDLKLQALTNYYTFQNYDLVRRSLYLYAATANENGLVYGTLFERPHPHPQQHYPIDYCLLYNTVLFDYYEATQDRATLEDLWIVAKYQVENVLPFISGAGEFRPSDDWWYFIDWNDRLDKQVALHGTVVYSLSKTWEIARLLGRENEVPGIPEMISRMKKFARQNYLDKRTMLFLSGDERQVSIASQVWMILSQTVSKKEGKQLLQRIATAEKAVRPVSPYLYHYLVEAMIACEMYREARAILRDYWGGMIEKGADTFWEVYDPENDFVSPYGSHIMNSYCHAWSCTPVYFLRKYVDVLLPE